MKYCPWCGAELINDLAKFCNECGKRVGTDEPPVVQFPSEWARTGVKLPEEEELPTRRAQENTPYSPEDSEDIFNLLPLAGMQGEPDEDDGTTPPPQVKKENTKPEKKPSAFYSFLHAKDEEEPKTAREPRAKKPKKITGTRILKRGKKHSGTLSTGQIAIAAGGICLVIAVCIGFLIYHNVTGASRMADQFVQAVSNTDTAFMAKNLEPQNGLTLSEEDYRSICKSLSQALKPEELKAHLLTMGDTQKKAYKANFNSFEMTEKSASIFFSSYVVKVYAAQILIQTGVSEMKLQVDGKPVETTQGENALKLQVVPGIHTIKGSYTQFGTEYDIGETQVSSFSAVEPTSISLDKNTSEVRVQLAGVETNLRVTVDGKDTGADVSSGILVLSPAFDGMKIVINCDQYNQEFTVTDGQRAFTVDLATQMEQQNPNYASVAPELLTNKQLIEHLSTRYQIFYKSYLQAINEWKSDLIVNVDETYLSSLVSRMEAYNKGLLFKLTSISVDRQSLQRSKQGEDTYASFSVSIVYDYAYTDKPDTWLAGGNKQTITMRYNRVSGQWEITETKTQNDEFELSSDLITLNN